MTANYFILDDLGSGDKELQSVFEQGNQSVEGLAQETGRLT